MYNILYHIMYHEDNDGLDRKLSSINYSINNHLYIITTFWVIESNCYFQSSTIWTIIYHSTLLLVYRDCNILQCDANHNPSLLSNNWIWQTGKELLQRVHLLFEKVCTFRYIVCWNNQHSCSTIIWFSNG